MLTQKKIKQLNKKLRKRNNRRRNREPTITVDQLAARLLPNHLSQAVDEPRLLLELQGNRFAFQVQTTLHWKKLFAVAGALVTLIMVSPSPQLIVELVRKILQNG